MPSRFDDDSDLERRRRKRKRQRREAGPETYVAYPAIGMMVCAGIHLTFGCVALIFNIASIAARGAAGGPDAPVNPIGSSIIGIILMIIQCVIIYGAIEMYRVANYQAAFTAATLSVIPCCSSCFILGMPFGIWAQIVLLDEDVKKAFG